MAISGNIQDLGIVSLLQFPGGGRRTGLLTVESGGLAAKLYYVDGQLVHAILDQLVGSEAVGRIITFEEGTFRFEDGQTTDEQTIKGHLSEVVMLAMASGDAEGDLQSRLKALVDSSTHLAHACILSTDGAIHAQTDCPGGLEERAAAAMAAFQGFVLRYPCSGDLKAVVEDSGISLVLAGLDENRALIGVAQPDIKTAFLLMAAEKMAEALRD